MVNRLCIIVCIFIGAQSDSFRRHHFRADRRRQHSRRAYRQHSGGAESQGISVLPVRRGSLPWHIRPQRYGEIIPLRAAAMTVSGSLLRFSVVTRELLHIDLYDMEGRRIQTLLNHSFDAGSHSALHSRAHAEKLRRGLLYRKNPERDDTPYMPFYNNRWK